MASTNGIRTEEPSRLSPIQRVNKSFDEHLYFWITLPLGLWLFLRVPQIRNVWGQMPPQDAGVLLTTGYWVFVAFVVMYYVLSLFVVLRWFPVERIQRG